MIQETVFSKKFDEPKRCPLVKEESDLTSSEEEEGDRRIANLIDFFFTIVRSQKDERKGSGGSCFRSEISPSTTHDDRIDNYVPAMVNTELEQKMETLIEFLATSACNNDENQKEGKKITLMEFLFGSDDAKSPKPIIEIVEVDYNKGISLSQSNINIQDISYIDETPVEETNETLVEMLMKYIDEKDKPCERKKSMSITPSLSEKSKSDITISKLETFSDISKTKSDSTLTHTQDTVIDRYDDCYSRRISETVIDLSHIKQDLEDIFEEAVQNVYRINKIIYDDDTMSDQEDIENFNTYTKPVQYIQWPYSIELSDILEEDETSSRDVERKLSENEKMAYITRIAEELLEYIDDRVQDRFDDSEFNTCSSLKRSSISLIDLRHIPDLPPSMIIKPKVITVDKSTSTTEISDSNSDLSKRIDSACNTEDTSLSSSFEKSERALDKMESLQRFFSKSRLEIIDETIEDNAIKSPKPACPDTETTSDQEVKPGQASLDDVEDLQDDVFDNETTAVDLERRCSIKDVARGSTSS